jgi:hypothetical protein
VKLGQLQQSIVGWEGKDIVANSCEIVYEGKLKVGTDKKKLKERYVVLCDGLLIVCSHSQPVQLLTATHYQYSLKGAVGCCQSWATLGRL